MTITIGDEAPDFELRDQGRQAVKLSDYRGRPVALVFYPFSFTRVCTGELCSLRDDYSKFEKAGVQVLAVSCDSSAVQKVFADQEGYEFPVLADYWPHGEVARRYGVFDDALGCATRTTFMIDADGTVVDRFGTDGLRTPREPERYDEAMARL